MLHQELQWQAQNVFDVMLGIMLWLKMNIIFF